MGQAYACSPAARASSAGMMKRYGLHPPCHARCIFAFLHRRGGSVRIGPLLRNLGLDQRIVLEAVYELSERYWITIVWRETAPRPVSGPASCGADEEACPLTDMHRLCTTPFGRRKYRASWPVD
jgi:hypothetical protein